MHPGAPRLRNLNSAGCYLSQTVCCLALVAQALNEACPNAPWSLTFSYGRALQATTLKVRTHAITRQAEL
jgi:hypothetical protein